MNKLTIFAPYAKAIIAALVTFLSSLVTALDSGGSISAQEWLTSVIALLVAGGAVFSIPNRPPFVPEAGQSE